MLSCFNALQSVETYTAFSSQIVLSKVRRLKCPFKRSNKCQFQYEVEWKEDVAHSTEGRRVKCSHWESVRFHGILFSVCCGTEFTKGIDGCLKNV